MKIVVNALPFRSSRHGVGRYIHNLLTSLLEIDHDTTYVVYVARDATEPIFTKPYPNLELRTLGVVRALRVVWEHTALPSILSREGADVYFGMGHVLPFWLSVAAVVTVHDLSWFVVPETHQWSKVVYFRWLIPRSLRRADRVIVDSMCTRQDVLNIVKIPESRICVALLGVEPRFHPRSEQEVGSALDALDLKRPYLLHLGVREPRKNLGALLEAYAGILNQRPDFPCDLVLAGERSYGWKTRSVERQLREPRLHGRVRVLGAVSDELLPPLIAGATVFVFPSFYEGFGLPVLEAMASGTPVVTTRVASLPEVCGNAACYIDDPRDPAQIASAIGRVLDNEELCRAMRIEGLRRSQEFTWHRCAEATLDGLRSACNESRR